MPGIKAENFVFGSDFLLKSESDFKAHMKSTHGVSAKKAKELYTIIHGNNSAISTKAIEDCQ